MSLHGDTSGPVLVGTTPCALVGTGPCVLVGIDGSLNMMLTQLCNIKLPEELSSSWTVSAATASVTISVTSAGPYDNRSLIKDQQLHVGQTNLY